MRISQRLFIRFWTCIYDYIPCFMRSMSILEEMLEMFVTTVQAELNATLHVCESGLQDVLTNRSNFTSNIVFQFLYGAWLVGISLCLSLYLYASVCPTGCQCVCPSVRNTADPTGRIFMKFHKRIFFENLLIKFKFL